MLNNIQKALFEIKYIISNDNDIKKMLYYDTTDALSKENITSLPIGYISLSPVQDFTETIYNKNTRINIIVYESELSDDDENLLLTGINIYVISKNDLWELQNNKIRTLEICNRIIYLLNNRVLQASNKISFASLETALLNKEMGGYVLLFSLVDGSGLENEF
jgi:hypothetical protein